jgi:hypothetical protein
VELPLPPILEKLPPDLRARLTTPITDLGEASVSIPANQILPQLATGTVRIEFGQLRGAAMSLFDVGPEYDSIAITLPLDVVLSRLNRRWLSRDAGQKKTESPGDIGSVFLRRADVSPSPGTVPSSPVKTPSSALGTETQIRVKMPSGSSAPAAPSLMTDTQIRIRKAPPTPAPAAPISPAISPLTPLPPAAPPKPVTSSIPFSSAPPKPAAPPIPFSSAPISPRPVAPPPSVSMEPPRPVGATAPPPGILAAPLLALSEKWPDALRNEITQLDLSNSQVFLPLDYIESGLKRGIVTFFWRDLRTYLHPTPLTVVSVHDGAALELPLKVIAPLFIARKGAVRPKLDAPVDKSIPNVFVNASAPKVEPPPAPVPPATPLPEVPRMPQPIVAPVAPLAAPSSPIAEQVQARAITPIAPPAEIEQPPAPVRPPEATPAEKARRLSPSDVLTRTMAMKGVEGAMVVLHDGLMVACELPPYLNSETAAAFLPQIYDRLSKCINELHMGPLSHLRFNVGNVTWLVFRQSLAYFAVFGREGELPLEAQLAPLAAELDRSRQ